jgi:NADH-quinone oxidoreductase subunit N
MTLGAFAVIAYLHHPHRPVETIEDLAGLARTHPGIAAATVTLMIGLTGIPLTAGFWGKLALFASAVTCHDSRYLWLAVIGVLNAAISSYYYLRIVMFMYMRDVTERIGLTPSPSLNLALVMTVVLICLIGVLPSIVIGGILPSF